MTPSTIEQLLAPLHPDENALTPRFRSHVDDPMLREIAAADYGWEADKCYSLLGPILHTGAISSDDFNLREVLELIKWSEPEDLEWSPGGHGPRGHWMRLFACTALISLAPKFLNHGGETDTLAQLTASAVELGLPVARATASMLSWRFLAYPGRDEDAAFLAFAILLLAAHLERGADRGPWLKELADWAIDEEARARSRISKPAWLLGVCPYHLRDNVWRTLARRILACPESSHPREADEILRRLGELVAGI